MTAIQVKLIETRDPEIIEAWERVTDETPNASVRAIRVPDDSWPWQVFVDSAKTVQSRPLQTQLETAVAEALETVLGVECIEREEPGLWVVAGSVNGRDLVAAVSVIVDSFWVAARAL